MRVVDSEGLKFYIAFVLRGILQPPAQEVVESRWDGPPG